MVVRAGIQYGNGGCPDHAYRTGNLLTGLGTNGYTHDMTESYKGEMCSTNTIPCDANAAWERFRRCCLRGTQKIANRYFKQELGVLKEGAAGDVIIVDYNPLRHRFMQGNINSHIVFGMTGRDVVSQLSRTEKC